MPSIRVCEVSAFGGPDVLRIAARPQPVAGPGEVVVRIEATAVNPTDVAARVGAHRRRMPDLGPPFVLGWDVAGVIADPGASALQAGAPVLGMIPWVQTGGRVGAYAEAAALDAGWLVPRPPELDAVTAATLPLNALTARQALDLIAAPPGSTLMITGASGAVGGFATQLAAGDGLRVLAVASDADEDWVRSLGAAEVLERGASLDREVDALLDAVPIGDVGCVRDGGTALFTRRISELEPQRGIRYEMPLVHVDAPMLADLTQQAADDRLRTRVAQTLDLDDAAEAHRRLERGGLRGKLVLTI
jgi:NADPH:quinone reductase-like Zn-dependent oxidoreductase